MRLYDHTIRINEERNTGKDIRWKKHKFKNQSDGQE